MLFNISLFLILLISAFIISCYMYILYYQRKVKASLKQLRELFNNKFALCADILDVAKDTYSTDSEILKSITDLLHSFIIAKRPEEFSLIDKKMTIALFKLEQLIEKYPLIYRNDTYLNINSSLIVLEEKIAFSRQFYNNAVEIYNKKISRMPAKIVSSIFDFKLKNKL